MREQARVYFPNLNGIRFIAAFLVMAHHVEQIKSILNMDSLWGHPFITAIGELGVLLFFVISGFLITYLLMEEKRSTGSVVIRHFYVRRILRIWPLYYVVVGLGFFVFPSVPFFSMGDLSAQVHTDMTPKIILFLFLMPNISSLFFPAVPYAAHTWSIGVEEQFYLLWPLLVKKCNNILLALIGVVFTYVLLKFVFLNVGESVGMQRMRNFLMTFNISCMAIGGVAAFILFNRNSKVLRIVYSKPLQASVFVLLVVLSWNGIKAPYIHHEVYAVLFGVVILNLAGNEKSILSLRGMLWEYLGRISYGLYMLHSPIIVAVLKCLLALGIDNSFYCYFLATALTILASGLSYSLFEERFIKKKKKYSTVLSGDMGRLAKAID